MRNDCTGVEDREGFRTIDNNNLFGKNITLLVHDDIVYNIIIIYLVRTLPLHCWYMII